MTRGKRCRRKAFTLVELLVTVMVIGALTAIAVPRIANASRTAKINVCKTNVDIMNKQIELHHANTGSWPNNLKDVTESTDYFPDGPLECPFGEKYKLDNDTHRIKLDKHNH